MSIVEYLILALASAVWPTLVAVVIVALTRDKPERLLLAFVIGGLMTTITVGLLIVFLLGPSIDATRSKTDPAVDILVGVLALVAGFVARRRERRQLLHPKPKKPKRQGPSRTERALEKGVLFAFLLGIVLDIAPSFYYLVALKDIAEADYSNTQVVLLVVVFCLIMFLLIELPLVGFAVAPEKTTVWARRFNAWLHGNAHRLVAPIAFGVGIFLIVRGVLSLF